MEEKKINEPAQNNDLFEDLIDEEDVIGSVSMHKKQEITFKTKLLGYLTVFLGILIVFIFGVYYFFKLSLKPLNSLNEYETQYVNIVKSLLSTILSTSSENISLTNKNSILDASKIFEYLNSPGVLFYDKLAFKENFENNFTTKLTSTKNTLIRYRTLLEKYKFFPQELQDIIKDIRVLPILTALNSIKLYVTDYVFIKANLFDDKVFSFVYPRSNFSTKYSNVPYDILKQKVISDLEYFKDKGAYIYLSTVYFNYMYTDNDNLSQLFFTKRFLTTFKTKLLNDYKFMKGFYPNLNKDQFISDYILLIKSIYTRTINLQEKNKTEILPVDVRLLSYNPSTQQLQFNIKLMLSPDIVANVDPVQLFSDIVTLLRESRLIIGKQIAYNSVKVKKVIKRIAGNKITFFSAEQKFTTLVQPQVDIEVTDTSY